MAAAEGRQREARGDEGAAHGNTRYLCMWTLHLALLAMMLFAIDRWTIVPAWYYLLLVAYPALSLAMVRSYYEHRAADDCKHRIAINETSWPMRLLYLNNNYHLVHHDLPAPALVSAAPGLLGRPRCLHRALRRFSHRRLCRTGPALRPDTGRCAGAPNCGAGSARRERGGAAGLAAGAADVQRHAGRGRSAGSTCWGRGRAACAAWLDGPDAHRGARRRPAGVVARARSAAVPDLRLSAGHGTRRTMCACWRCPNLHCRVASGIDYRSVILVPQAGARSLEELRGSVAVINQQHSHSGMNALRHSIAPLARDGRFFSRVTVSGSHLDSIAALQQGQAAVRCTNCSLDISRLKTNIGNWCNSAIL